jgi:hypothetical protein
MRAFATHASGGALQIDHSARDVAGLRRSVKARTLMKIRYQSCRRRSLHLVDPYEADLALTLCERTTTPTPTLYFLPLAATTDQHVDPRQSASCVGEQFFSGQ